MEGVSRIINKMTMEITESLISGEKNLAATQATKIHTIIESYEQEFNKLPLNDLMLKPWREEIYRLRTSVTLPRIIESYINILFPEADQELMMKMRAKSRNLLDFNNVARVVSRCNGMQNSRHGRESLIDSEIEEKVHEVLRREM